MDSDISQRKQQHISLAQDPEAQMQGSPFSKFQLPYTALPELDLEEVDTTTELFGKSLSQPLIIASMTGGTEHAKKINSNLAEAAQETGVAIGVGSMRITLEHESAKDSFKIVRDKAPSALIFANMAAVQLNYQTTVDQYQHVIDLIQADALYLHLNPLQEALQPGGDSNFSDLLRKIQTLVHSLEVPVFIKEVGHGLSPANVQQLIQVGVSGVDIAGTGGTSWAWIEATRADNKTLASWFKEVGWPSESVLQNIDQLEERVHIVASGGIRNPVQALKAHLLGADYYSAASPFLKPALESFEAVTNLISLWQKGLQVALFSIGAKNWLDAKHKELISK